MSSAPPPAGWDGDYSDAASTFGDRITVARQARNMTQAQLARRLGIRIETLSNWEHDRSEPRANKLQMLAGLLNVSIIWLMSGEGDAPALDPTPSTSGAETVEAIVSELRDLRLRHADIGQRLGRLEKRLRALDNS
ncbi:MAG: helix-turn-helix transcriptional regulator [Pseudomonadota bacterium]